MSNNAWKCFAKSYKLFSLVWESHQHVSLYFMLKIKRLINNAEYMKLYNKTD